MDYEKTRMLHVWKDCFDELEFEGLSYDIVLFIGALVIPRLVLIMMSIVPYRPSLFCVLWSGLQSLIMSLYVICMPFFLYRLILSIVLYIMNRPKGESKEPILLEPRDEGRSRDAELEKIPYYQELRPADSFTGAMMKTARRRTFLIFVPVAIYVLWSIIAG